MQVFEWDSDVAGVPVPARVFVRRVFVWWAEVDSAGYFSAATASGGSVGVASGRSFGFAQDDGGFAQDDRRRGVLEVFGWGMCGVVGGSRNRPYGWVFGIFG